MTEGTEPKQVFGERGDGQKTGVSLRTDISVKHIAVPLDRAG